MAWCCRVLQCVTVGCSVMQCIAVRVITYSFAHVSWPMQLHVCQVPLICMCAKSHSFAVACVQCLTHSHLLPNDSHICTLQHAATHWNSAVTYTLDHCTARESERDSINASSSYCDSSYCVTWERALMPPRLELLRDMTCHANKISHVSQ